jgi:hypothetical protein
LICILEQQNKFQAWFDFSVVLWHIFYFFPFRVWQTLYFCVKFSVFNLRPFQ